MPIIRTLRTYVSKDVRILGYFSEPKGVHEQKSLENIDLGLSGRNMKLIFYLVSKGKLH